MSSQEQKVILDWMFEIPHKFISNPNGNRRKYYIFSDDPSAPEVLSDIKKRIYKKACPHILARIPRNLYIMDDVLGVEDEFVDSNTQ